MKKVAAYVGLAHSVERVYSRDTLQTLSGRYDFIADGKTLTKEELLARLSELRQELAELDAREPKNQNSEAYEDWADEHEDLEDDIDEVLEQLEEL